MSLHEPQSPDPASSRIEVQLPEAVEDAIRDAARAFWADHPATGGDVNVVDALYAITRAMDRNLVSPNEADRNGEPANLVDGLYRIARAVDRNFTSSVSHMEAVAPSSVPHGSPNLVDGAFFIGRSLGRIATALEEMAGLEWVDDERGRPVMRRRSELAYEDRPQRYQRPENGRRGGVPYKDLAHQPPAGQSS